ncbi:ABC transporter substrate-binding protein [Natrarchaeobius halalkaliphilus]|uniref:ABC transporter substrate-binding protein n=1 Tax=Natrarchaeobius halalkaliphilus TaxID=1679091 RepID=A0A3N6M4N5_9EURY|nr:ABC transporter substrate-binding protein [Natrarchaeobius halalkaliphilus]RQG90201.1 ABC transporter substrate-binding protein [Natrarchaeobius halalkaliphilus]
MIGSVPDGDSERRFGRRAMLAATTGATVSISGCVRELRSVVNRDGIDQLELTITTVPADGDRESIQIARALRNVLEDAGMDVSIEMRSHEEFLRSILINHDFDVYVGQHPGGTDPDYLYETLHSRYVDEAGWQNPFGFANLVVDDLLERQRAAAEDDRETAVTETLEAVATEQPFVPICFPDEYRLARTDRFDGWEDAHLARRDGYLGLEPIESEGETGTDTGAETLRVVHTDARLSENLNPISVEYRDQGTMLDLLYDSLGSVDAEDELVPWLAVGWDWDEETMTIDLRERCLFHDGETLTADDVAFSYRFLSDTTLGDDVSAPTPRYRGRIESVETIEVTGEYELELSFATGRPAAEQALTVPILPEHVWSERASSPTVRGVRVARGTTEALVTDNVPPIGSGPFAFSEWAERDYVELERFADHFSLRDDVDRPEPTVDRVRIAIDPRSTSAIELVNGADADVTSLPLESYVVDDVLESTPDDVRVLESPSWSFYHLGFNTRSGPFSNPRFRRLVAGLVDKEWLIENVFDGHARPIATPVTPGWTPESLEWDGNDPVTPFLGSNGEIDLAAVRAAVEEAGFRHDGERLRVRR